VPAAPNTFGTTHLKPENAGDVLPVKKQPPTDSGGRSRVLRLLVVLCCVVIALTLVLLGFVAWLVTTPVPDITLTNIAERSAQPSVIYAADDSELVTWHGDEERTPLAADDIGQTVMDATVAVEDRRFFEHSGVDARGIMRALQRNTQAGVIKEGGSTITQQLMKMLYTGGERTLSRKISEAIKATRVEMGYDKRQILAAYLNMSYFGQGAYGIENAAQTYFGVEPAQLSVAQAATLAGMLHSPSAYQPYSDPDPVRERRDTVLDLMYQQGLISAAEHDAATAEPLELTPRENRNVDARYPWFVDYVQRELPDLIDADRVDRGGLRIYTTLDPELQEAAQQAADAFKAKKDPTVSLVTMRHSDGAILAMIGGKDWQVSQFNIAVQGRRQPGSAFKPLTLIAALQDGVPLSRSYSTAPYETPVKDEIWHVTNYDGQTTGGAATVEAATIRSINTVYARLIIDIGADKTLAVARALGFEAPMEADPALALGGLKYGVSPLEMARAYTAMAKQGEYIPAHAVTRIVDADGTVLYAAPESIETTRVFSAKIGAEVRSVLHKVVTQGTGTAAQLPGDVWAAGKTGTTQSYRDAWFVGWAQGATTAVWMGYPEAQISMDDVHGKRVTGGSFPAQIWEKYMAAAIKLRPQTGLTGGSLEATATGSNDIPTLEEIGVNPDGTPIQH
jgi:penicillin-binding protein 1A